MTTQSPSNSLAETLKGYRVIDSDAHWTEPPDLWSRQAPASLKDRVMTIKRFGNIDHWWMNGESWGTLSGTVVGTNGEKHRGMLSLMDYSVMDRRATDPKLRVQYMDEMGLWAQILYPN